MANNCLLVSLPAPATRNKTSASTRPFLRPIQMNRTWQPADIPSLTNKRVLITGANSGIGYHAALKLARKGAHVLLACRNRQRGEAALARLDTDAPSAHTELVLFDLASLASIRAFAGKELAQRRPLHILINNAGVMAP